MPNPHHQTALRSSTTYTQGLCCFPMIWAPIYPNFFFHHCTVLFFLPTLTSPNGAPQLYLRMFPGTVPNLMGPPPPLPPTRESAAVQHDTFSGSIVTAATGARICGDGTAPTTGCKSEGGGGTLSRRADGVPLIVFFSSCCQRALHDR